MRRAVKQVGVIHKVGVLTCKERQETHFKAAFAIISICREKDTLSHQ